MVAGVFGWVLMALLVAAGLGWEYAQRRAQGDDRPARRLGAAWSPEYEQRARLALIDAVRSQWVSGVLGRSLEMLARIEVGLTHRPDAVDQP